MFCKIKGKRVSLKYSLIGVILVEIGGNEYTFPSIGKSVVAQWLECQLLSHFGYLEPAHIYGYLQCPTVM